MAFYAVVGIEFLYAIATLILISLGLAVIFGMMRIINLAHGEFLVLGSYAVTVATHHGVNLWIAILMVAPVTVAIIGAVLERVFIRFLYGRILDTMLATWGLSLFVVGILTAIFGETTEGVATPVGAVAIGAYSVSVYRFFVIGFAALALAGVYLVLRHTRLGLVARGTMQNPAMAEALGVDTSRVYCVTFALGAGLAGLAGGAYLARAFITVIGGGSAVIAGTSSASVLFGVVSQAVTFASTQVYGEVALLLVAILLIRLLPQGVTGRFFRGSL
jgi:branched-subunit amino acid ABC-type transport system permease component